MITQQQVKELFLYKDGLLVCKKTNSIKQTPITKSHRYHRVVIDGIAYSVHRLVYLYHYGFLPKIIDHVDNNPSNNKIENLRDTTQQKNCLNRKIHKNNRSGCKNVHWSKAMSKWCVSLFIDGKRNTIGHFLELEFADLVAQEARSIFHKEFARS